MAAYWRVQLSLNLSTITVPFIARPPLKVPSGAWDGSHGAIMVARALSVSDRLSLGCHLKLLLLQSPCLQLTRFVQYPTAVDLNPADCHKHRGRQHQPIICRVFPMKSIPSQAFIH
jgi:hypothetical protein